MDKLEKITMFGQAETVEIVLRESIIQLQLASMYPPIPDPDVRDVNFSHRCSYWSTVKNSLLGMGVARWCHVFGARSEKTHWRKLAWSDAAYVKENFLSFANVNEDDWEIFHSNAKKTRDRFVAHVDIEFEAPNLFRDRDQEILLKTSMSLRDQVVSLCANLYATENITNDDDLTYLDYVVRIPSEEVKNQATNMYTQGMESLDLTK